MSTPHATFRNKESIFPSGDSFTSGASLLNGHSMRRLIRKLHMPLKWLVYRTGRVVVRTNPDRLYVESTNQCNLSCIMCPKGLGEITRPLGHMDIALFRSIVDEMAPRVETAVLHIWGEPLLHPRLVEMIRYCHQMGLRTEISTNAVALTEEKSHQLLESGLDAIYLCLDGTDSRSYQQIRRGGDYETTRNNILRFIERRRVKGHNRLRVYIQMVEMNLTAGHIPLFKKQWQIDGVDWVHIKALDTWSGQIEDVNKLRRESGPSLPPRYPCPNLWYHAHIFWDGTLVCCDRDYNAQYPLGNVAHGVMRAWNGPAMVELRRKHCSGDLDDMPACSRCTEWSWWRPRLFSSRGNSPEDR